jgi:hypothetical protein
MTRSPTPHDPPPGPGAWPRCARSPPHPRSDDASAPEAGALGELGRRLEIRFGSAQYHLRTLERAGIARRVGARRKRGGVEPLFEVPHSLWVDHHADAPLGTLEAVHHAYLAAMQRRLTPRPSSPNRRLQTETRSARESSSLGPRTSRPPPRPAPVPAPARRAGARTAERRLDALHRLGPAIPDPALGVPTPRRARARPVSPAARELAPPLLGPARGRRGRSCRAPDADGPVRRGASLGSRTDRAEEPRFRIFLLGPARG